jgi:RimJ/RimL family protein N-acetyltransferase
MDPEPSASLNADSRVREFFPTVQMYQESADWMEYIRDNCRTDRSATFHRVHRSAVPSFDGNERSRRLMERFGMRRNLLMISSTRTLSVASTALPCALPVARLRVG